jgi:hypothetical protein
VSSTSDYLDKSWIVCDTTSTSPDYGNCYVEFDDNSQGNHIYMLTSTDGGVTWSAPRSTADSAFGLGGQPLVQPNGTVVVPYFADLQSQIRSFVSTDGGSSWGSSVEVSTQSDHGVDGGLRTEPLPSAEIDAAGTVYLVWQDCRFRTGCQSNDMVLSTSTDGTTWSPVQRVPIDPVNSGEDHFIPGLAVDRTTSGSSAHLGLAYYFYPNAVCSSSTCQLEVGYVSSTNGGVTWSAPTTVAGPMTMNELASTSQGFMVGDYISTSIAGGRAYPVFAVGLPLSGSTFNEAMYTVPGGLPVTGGSAFGSFETGVSPAVTPSVRPPGTAT